MLLLRVSSQESSLSYKQEIAYLQTQLRTHNLVKADKGS